MCLFAKKEGTNSLRNNFNFIIIETCSVIVYFIFLSLFIKVKPVLLIIL